MSIYAVAGDRVVVMIDPEDGPPWVDPGATTVIDLAARRDRMMANEATVPLTSVEQIWTAPKGRSLNRRTAAIEPQRDRNRRGPAAELVERVARAWGFR